MNGALVVIFIYSGAVPREQCTETTARAVVSTRIEPVICGVGVLVAPSRADIGSDEFVRVICKTGGAGRNEH